MVKAGESLAPAGEHSEFMEDLSSIMAGTEQGLALSFLNSTVRAVPSRDDGKLTAANDALAAIAALAPKDTLETMMACSIVALHQHAMDLLGRVGSSPLSGVSEVRLNLSNKIFRQFLAHVKALDAHRRQSQPTQQHIIVEHISIENGGQMAIMGQVQTGGGGI
jgi:hypothetical protein